MTLEEFVANCASDCIEGSDADEDRRMRLNALTTQVRSWVGTGIGVFDAIERIEKGETDAYRFDVTDDGLTFFTVTVTKGGRE